jgi:hypothetical protein
MYPSGNDMKLAGVIDSRLATDPVICKLCWFSIYHQNGKTAVLAKQHSEKLGTFTIVKWRKVPQ